MNVVAYNVVMVIAMAIALRWLRERVRFDIYLRRLILLAAGVGGALGLLALVGMLLFGGNIFGAAQLGAWAIFLHVPLFLIGGGLLIIKRHAALAVAAWAGAALLGLVALDAFLIEPHWLDVSHLTLASPKVAAPIRVVVLADIQTDRPGAYETRVLETAMAQSPDLILFAGDYIHLGRRSRGYEAEAAALNELLREQGVEAPIGIYAVAGNVDEPGIWPRIFAGLNATTFERTQQVDLGPLVVTGLSRADAFGVRTQASAPDDAFHIVLGHSPNFSLAPVEGDLLIAGHTHGGQVRLPFIGPLVTLTVVPRSWAAGVTEIAPDTTLVVSRGIGMERGYAPRLRFLCRPELVVIDLVPQ